MSLTKLTIVEANGKVPPKRGPFDKGTCTVHAILPTTERGVRRRKAAMAGYEPPAEVSE
jgi:hypothetical protein